MYTGRINDIRLIACVTLVGILALAIVGMDWVTRVQMGLLVTHLTWFKNLQIDIYIYPI
jgi:hypothetical protein